MRIAVACSRVRAEEKLLFTELERRGLPYVKLDDREQIFDLQRREYPFDVLLERCIQHSRALYLLKLLNDAGVPTVNSYQVAHTCGDKLLTTQALIRAEVPTPACMLAFTPESALAAMEQLGYPVVLKPVIGSWGRMVSKIKRPRRRRGHPRASRCARQLPALDLLHSAVHPQAGPRYSLLRGRRRVHRCDLPH
jgi:L-2-aminoadipate N-acetyltransferase (EC 2.3.1.-)